MVGSIHEILEQACGLCGGVWEDSLGRKDWTAGSHIHSTDACLQGSGTYDEVTSWHPEGTIPAHMHAKKAGR